MRLIIAIQIGFGALERSSSNENGLVESSSLRQTEIEMIDVGGCISFASLLLDIVVESVMLVGVLLEF